MMDDVIIISDDSAGENNEEESHHALDSAGPSGDEARRTAATVPLVRSSTLYPSQGASAHSSDCRQPSSEAGCVDSDGCHSNLAPAAANRCMRSRHERQDDRTYVCRHHRNGREGIGLFAKRSFQANAKIAEFVDPRVIDEREYLSVLRPLAPERDEGRQGQDEEGPVQNKAFAIPLPGSKGRSWVVDNFILSGLSTNSCRRTLSSDATYPQVVQNTWYALAYSEAPNVDASIEYRDQQGSESRVILRYP